MVASRTTIPTWAPRAAYAAILLVDGLAAFQIGGVTGAALVGAAVVGLFVAEARFALPRMVLGASLAVDYALLRALADPAHASPLPFLEAALAIGIPVIALPWVLRGPNLLARWGLWLAGTAALSLLTERYFIRVASVLAPDDIFASAIGVLLIAAATFVRTERFGRVAAALALGTMVLTALLALGGSHYVSDGTVAIDEAARVALRGGDPYVSVDLGRALDDRGLPRDLLTKLEDGDSELHLVYPAASFLPSALLVDLGVDDVRYGFLAVLVIAYGFISVRAPLPLAPYVGALALVNVMALRQVTLAGVEPGWFLFMVLALVLPGRRSGAATGLSAAARQIAWVYLPWLLVDQWRRGRSAGWAITAAATFLAVNVAFIVPDPAAWLAGITSPFRSAYEPLGSGIIRFAIDGPVTLPPRIALTVAPALVGLLALWTYARHRDRWRYGLAVLPVTAFYVAWRSLQNYFMFAPLLLLLLIVEDRPSQEPGGAPDR